MLKLFVLAWVVLRASPSIAAAVDDAVVAQAGPASAECAPGQLPDHSGDRAWLICRNPSARRCVLLREPAACGDAEAPGVLEARLSLPIGPADLDAAMSACRARLPH